MQRIYLFVLLISFHEISRAECEMTGFSVWPDTKTVAPNSIFVIEGYGMTQLVIENLNRVNKIYLISGTDTVPLRVLRRYKSQFRLTQAVVQPERLLKSGRQYTLYFDYLDPENKAAFYTYQWNVRQHLDNEKPVWRSLPKYHSKTYVAFGCGPATYVSFNCRISDKSETLVYAKVTNKKTNASADYLLSPDKHKVALGHEMCSGAFYFDETDPYEVQFGLIDASGNENLVLTKPISFIPPNENDKSKMGKSLDLIKNNNYNPFLSEDDFFAKHFEKHGLLFVFTLRQTVFIINRHSIFIV